MKLYQTKLYLVSTVFASEKEAKPNESKQDNQGSDKRNNHFGRIYFDVINNENFRDLSPMAFKIYGSLLEYADWRTGMCYPTQRTLAENCGCSRKTVNLKIKELEKRGYIRKGYNNEGDRPIYYIIAYEEQGASQEGVTPGSHPVTRSSQGCEAEVTGGVTPGLHELESVTKINNDNQQQQNNLEDGDLIRVTSNNGKPVTVESVCCRISSLFSKKFHTELPYRFIKEKINPGEVFDDQFYIKIIQTQQKMPDNPIGWWRSIDSTWVIDENARPVDSVGRGWQIYTKTVDVDPEEEAQKEQEEKLREEEEKLRAEAEKIREERLKEAILSFPPPEEYAKKRVQGVVEVRNMMVSDNVLHATPYTEEEISKMRKKYIESYPFSDEQKRKVLLWYNGKEFDTEKIMEELREKRRLEKSESV